MMKKTLIAAGVAAVMAVPAIAAADVQLSARLQTEIVNISGDGNTANGKGWYMTDAMSGGNVNSGNFSGVALTASHDLGNGLTAFAKAESNLLPTNWTNSGTRDVFVGLRGGFGSVQFGRQTTAFATSGKDPFHATFMQARGNGAMIGAFGGLGNGSYVDNAIGYSGKFEMVSVNATFGLDQTENVGGGDKNNAEHMYALRVNVDLSPVEIWVAHTNANEYGGATQTGGFDADGDPQDTRDFQSTKVGAEFKTGAFGVMAQYETIKHENATTGADTANAGDFIMVAGTYRMGANTFMLGYGQFDAELDNRDVTWVAAGVRHAFNRNVSVHGGVRQSDYDNPAVGKETAVGAGMRVVF